MSEKQPVSDPSSSAHDLILGYLKRHPHGKDTIEGIMHWWLLDEQIYRAEPVVQAALVQLEAEGWVLTERTGEGRILYSLNPAKGREG